MPSEILVNSVDIQVVDENGDVVEDVTVTYVIDDGPVQDAECTAVAQGGKCSEWSAGSEETGTFDVRAVSADGSKSGHAEIDVGKDIGACHVTTEMLIVTIK